MDTTIMDQACNENLAVIALIVAAGHIIAFAIGLVVVLVSTYKSKKLSITVVETLPSLEEICFKLKKDTKEYKILGVDTEWVTVNKKKQPIALLQLCSVNGTCALVRLSKFKTFPQVLKVILQDSKVIKVGLEVHGDANSLWKDYGVLMKDTLDLHCLYPTKRGLATLAKDILGITLSKDLSIRCGDWEAENLNQRQIEYAAMDAYVAIEIFKVWAGIKTGKPKWDDIEADIHTYLNDNVKFGKYNGELKRKKLSMKDFEYNQKMMRSKRFATQKKQIYDNCYMRAPDGTLLCSIRKSRAEWYLAKEKAELISEEPYVIRLLFTPKVIPKKFENLFNKEMKRDCCVVCGSKTDLLKHWIVPKMYSKHFPLLEKVRYSHDILVMCLTCYLPVDSTNCSFREKLRKMAGIALPERPPLASKTFFYAKALLKHGEGIPEPRQTFMQNAIKEIHNSEEITKELLEEIVAAQENQVHTPSDHILGEQVVEFFKSHDPTMYSFRRLWRQHFLETMSPKFLPKHWSLDYKNDS